MKAITMRPHAIRAGKIRRMGVSGISTSDVSENCWPELRARFVLVELRRLSFPTVTRQAKGRVAKIPWARLGRMLPANRGFRRTEIGKMVVRIQVQNSTSGC